MGMDAWHSLFVRLFHTRTDAWYTLGHLLFFSNFLKRFLWACFSPPTLAKSLTPIDPAASASWKRAAARAPHRKRLAKLCRNRLAAGTSMRSHPKARLEIIWIEQTCRNNFELIIEPTMTTNGILKFRQVAFTEEIATEIQRTTNYGMVSRAENTCMEGDWATLVGC